MKTTKVLFLVVILSVAFGFAWSQDKGNGNIVTKTISVSSFSKISALGSFDVILNQTGTEKVVVEGDENLIQYFKADVSGSELSLNFSKNNLKPTKFIVHVDVKNINKVEVTGSGDLKTGSTITADKFKLDHVGSGNLDFDVSSKELKIEVTGSGDAKINAKADVFKLEHTGSGNAVLSFDNPSASIDIEHTGSGNFSAVLKSTNAKLENSGSGDFTASGITTNLKLENNGSGNFEGEKYSADKLDVEMNGSGSVSLKCNMEASVEINGSGDLHLKGNYTVNKIETTGSGRLIK
ncbi:MAG: DUF2807 domain-containing protein [Ignavibacteria bacterium]|jgi:hypothetical protein|nr:DUF2807 domain-containing protein [Ignavibacteria bacterium]